MITSYKDLIVWQKSMDLVTLIYKITDKFPKTEIYGLTSQMRRCAVSIPSNIAEGSARKTRRDYGQFLHIAYGSGAELETQAEIAKRLGFNNSLDYNKINQLLIEVMKMLNTLIGKLEPKL